MARDSSRITSAEPKENPKWKAGGSAALKGYKRRKPM
jgi:hypothetical protein